jgi:hypothetical protein
MLTEVPGHKNQNICPSGFVLVKANVLIISGYDVPCCNYANA